MIKFNKIGLVTGSALLFVVGFVGGNLWQKTIRVSSTDLQRSELNNDLDTTSPYVGQEIRGIKSLSQEEVEALLAGEGTPFGGMAKLAELNGYPGPRHVLDMASELTLSEAQLAEVENLYDQMKNEAIVLGEQMIGKEEDLDSAFGSGSISEEELRRGIAESAQVYADLRYLHLNYHLLMTDVLNEDQIAKYNDLRGYKSSGEPCENVPEGHDPELWKMHNGCT